MKTICLLSHRERACAPTHPAQPTQQQPQACSAYRQQNGCSNAIRTLAWLLMVAAILPLARPTDLVAAEPTAGPIGRGPFGKESPKLALILSNGQTKVPSPGRSPCPAKGLRPRSLIKTNVRHQRDGRPNVLQAFALDGHDWCEDNHWQSSPR